MGCRDICPVLIKLFVDLAKKKKKVLRTVGGVYCSPRGDESTQVTTRCGRPPAQLHIACDSPTRRMGPVTSLHSGNRTAGSHWRVDTAWTSAWERLPPDQPSDQQPWPRPQVTACLWNPAVSPPFCLFTFHCRECHRGEALTPSHRDPNPLP